MTWLVNQHGVGERRAGEAMQIQRPSDRYFGRQEEQEYQCQRVDESVIGDWTFTLPERSVATGLTLRLESPQPNGFKS